MSNQLDLISTGASGLLANFSLPAAMQVSEFTDFYALNDFDLQARLRFELAAFAFCVTEYASDVAEFDVATLDLFIASIDAQVTEQLDIILHSDCFQRCEALWTSLDYLLQ